MSWILVIVSGLLEAAWALGLKASDGFTRLVPTALTFAGMLTSFVLLSIAARELPIGTAYAVWTGIGTAGTALLGMWLFGESASPLRIACIGLIIAGVLGLKLAGDGGH